MSARGGGKKRDGFLVNFAHKHDRELVHAGIFFVVGLVFLGAYSLVGVAAARHSFEVVRAKIRAVQQPVEIVPPVVVELEEPPTELPRRLDGVIVPVGEENRLPACVMIENAAFGGVRPQSGLSAAAVVYEVIVEGGITRLMAVYDGELAETIGPVRSARDTYLEFASELNCPYLHAGGSFTALQALDNFGLRDLDGLIESRYVWRDPAKYAPHNLFTSGENLRQAISDHGWDKEAAPSYDSWNFVDPVDQTVGTPAARIQIGFGGSYDVEYRYRETEQVYERWNGGVLHTDANTGEAILVKNVVLQEVAEGTDIEGKGRVNWPVTGEGAVHIFHGGQEFVGRWQKPDRLARTQFFADDGTLLPLWRGNTWVEIVPPHIAFTIE